MPEAQASLSTGRHHACRRISQRPRPRTRCAARAKSDRSASRRPLHLKPHTSCPGFGGGIFRWGSATAFGNPFCAHKRTRVLAIWLHHHLSNCSGNNGCKNRRVKCYECHFTNYDLGYHCYGTIRFRRISIWCQSLGFSP